ncbi:MAG: hypothetical protein AUJ07_06430 [Crenarchaeota archaeon 13_1_40CM_3_53_5]|nr:MAG: hypothetical protein AUJ07_06430 [Crenarchaeota archaeon 13_1_40CM_3_53_5]
MFLYKLAELGAHEKEIPLTTGDVAGAVGSSQQTASRRLIEMESDGLVVRTKVGRNQRIQITTAGLGQLTFMHQVLRRVFESPKDNLIIHGIVFTGLSEGSYYVGLEGYRKQFRAKLGFDPYPGTLNLRVKREDLNERRMLESFPSVYIEGYKVSSAIIVPIRAHYGEDVIELISPHQLRKQLKLKDGDVVTVKVLLQARGPSSQ